MIYQWVIKMYKEVCVGIDQSYENTGVSISADGKLLKVTSLYLGNLKSNSEKRSCLKNFLSKVIHKVKPKCENITCVIERIRLRSQGFINIDYIKSIGALNAVIVDVMSDDGIPVYSVDTRCWKAQIVGTSKPMDNKFGVPPEKWPTVQWCISKGFKDSILKNVSDSRKEKGTFRIGDKKYMYNNDAADSSAISMFLFDGDKSMLKVEK